MRRSKSWFRAHPLRAHFWALLFFLSCALQFSALVSLSAGETDYFAEGADFYIRGDLENAVQSLEKDLGQAPNHRQAKELLKIVLVEAIEKDIDRGRLKETFPKIKKLTQYFANDADTKRLSKRVKYSEKEFSKPTTIVQASAMEAGGEVLRFGGSFRAKKEKINLKPLPFSYSTLKIFPDKKLLPAPSPDLSSSPLALLSEDPVLKLENRFAELQNRWEKEKEKIWIQAENRFNQRLEIERSNFRQMLLAWTASLVAGLGIVVLLIYMVLSHKAARAEKRFKIEIKNALALIQSQLNKEGLPFAGVLHDESNPQGFYNLLQHHCQRIFTALELGESDFALETKSLVAKLIENIREEKREYLTLALRPVTAHDYYLAHPVNVAIFSTAVGLCSELEEDEILELALSALLHDVGVAKMIPILSRSRISGQNLKPEELDQIKDLKYSQKEVLSAMVDFDERTCQRVAAILSKTSVPPDLLHVESDKPNKVEMIATIINVCESFETATHYRPYHQPLTAREGIEKLQRSLRDPYARKALSWLMKELQIFPLGTFVRLSNGKVGEITFADSKTGQLEVVVAKGSIGRFSVGERITLSQNSPTLITEILSSI